MRVRLSGINKNRVRFRVRFRLKLRVRFNRYRRKSPKVEASIFDSALSHTRRSDASKKRRKILASTFGRFRVGTSFEFSLYRLSRTLIFSFSPVLLAYIFPVGSRNPRISDEQKEVLSVFRFIDR